MKILSKVILVAGIDILFASCRKEGLGGRASVSGFVKHHAMVVPHAVVYIKYGATEFPGEEVAIYDASTVADANAKYEFTNLQKGDYYLYATAFDTLNMQSLNGGIGIVLKKTEAKITDVPISE